MVLDDRSKKILEAVIKEFIRLGKPVSSSEICSEYDLGVKSATIRNELIKLEELGYIYQPHTSGGRVPTDAGYKFFASLFMEDIAIDLAEKVSGIFESIFQELNSSDTKGIVETMSEELGLLSIGKSSRELEVHKSGLDNLFEKLVGNFLIEDELELFKVVQDFEKIDDRMEELKKFISTKSLPLVFIGKSPITKSENLSVIVDMFKNGDEEIILGAIGPKWMDYRKPIKFFKELGSILNKNEV
ncbi:MAG: hypothetical protein EXS49_00915 [Candidatus Pacebacteria bacterium]|nr:hypothetical protein [Candidatus Paceibacterota bacterium]